MSGSIAFIGLMVPHLLRRFTGPRAMHLLPACVAGGAAFLMACELISRSLSATVPLHLGILTAFLGGAGFPHFDAGRRGEAIVIPPTVSAQNIVVRIGPHELLREVTLELPPGSMTVLLGPNGAGKTTLMRVLAGILRPSAGSVQLGADPLADLARTAVARQIAYLPQQTASQFAVTVEDVVGLGRYPYAGVWGGLSRLDYEHIHRAIERVGLIDLRRRTLPTLSGGRTAASLCRPCSGPGSAGAAAR